MKALIGVAVLSMMLAAVPTFAQAPAPAAPAPQQTAPAPAPAPAPQTPAPQAPAAAAPQVPVVAPFPVGTKYGFVNIQRLTQETAEGKAAFARLQSLNTQKVNELNAKNKELQGLQQKLDAGANVLSINAAAELQKQIERLTVDIQRFTEDAQAEMTTLQTQLQAEFEQRIGPVLQAVAKERGLHMLLSLADAGLVWWDPSLDLTAEVIARADAAAPAAQRPAATAPAAPRPAAPAPAAPRPAAPATPAPQTPVRP